MSEIKEIPKHWEVKKLGDVCEKITNGANAKQFDENIGLPISRIETIWNQQIDINRVKYIKENGRDFIEKYSLKFNDILFSHINSDIHLGKTAIYKSAPKILIHGINLLLIRTNHLVNPIYFNYYLIYLRARGKFISIAQKSVNQSSINQSKLKNVDVIVPPLPEQQAIVVKIEELLSELDNGKQQLQTAQQLLKVYRKSLLKWSFEGKLTNRNVKDGELPKGWKIEKLGVVCEIKNGKNQNIVVNPNGKYPIYGSAGKMGYADSYLCEAGSTIVGRKGTINKPLYVNEKFWNVDTAFGFMPNNDLIINRFLYYFCLSFNFAKLDKSTTIPSLAKTDLQKIEVIIPPLKEQQIIVSKLESKFTFCDKIEETIIQSLQQVETLRQSILKKAFEGRLTTINN
jgi:type I restriction enzyme, S subunit